MGDYRVQNLLLMQSPGQPFVVTITYLLLVAKIGPYFMAKRQRFDLVVAIRLYNVLQIIFNVCLCTMSLKVVGYFSIWCSPSAQGESGDVLYIIKLHHLYVLSKMFDLVETVFFVLRKKTEQVSFLHVFHHIGVVWLSWISCKYFPGGQSFLPALLNTFVHSFMYLYYLQSSRGKIISKLWKKCITSLQIGHQVIIVALYMLPLFNTKCSYPKSFLSLILGYVIVVIYLFMKFYKKNYARK